MITEVKRVVWRDDPDAETILGMVGAETSVRDIDFDDVDDIASANNCARMSSPLNEEKVTEYEASMRRGDVFPRIVVESGKKGFIVLGGNQRYSAAKRYGITQAEVYVVKSLSENHRQAVIRSLNSRHGWGTEKSDRIEHAVYLVRSCGFTTDDAARLMSVSPPAITTRIRAEDTRHQLGAAGVESNKLSQASLCALARITDEDIQKQVAKLAVVAQIQASSVEAISAQIQAAKGKAKRVEILKEWTKEVVCKSPTESNRGTTLKTPRRDKLLRLLTGMVDFLDRGNDGTGFTSLDELQCSEVHDGDRVRMLAAKIVLRLKTITG